MTDQRPTTADERARRYAEQAQALAGDDTAPAFDRAVPVDRSDPYDAFATPITASSVPGGPLDGLRVATKDNVAVAGVTHRAGTGDDLWSPDADATVVERLRAAGATLVGSTRMDALALGVTGEACRAGRTLNPAVDGAVPGGSSSGSAAAVAGGLADAALGTDTGGSVRVPAAFCGVVGVKPTYDRVPRTGVLDLAPTLDHVGVVASDVETAARTLDTISGDDPVGPATGATAQTTTSDAVAEPPGRLRVGVPESFVEAADRRVAAVFERATTLMAERPGTTVRRCAFPEHETAEVVNQIHTLTEFAATHDESTPTFGVAGGPASESPFQADLRDLDLPNRVRRLWETGQALTETDAYADAWRARRRLSRRTQACLDEVDVLVTPTTPMPAPAFDAVGDGPQATATPGEVLANTAPFNCTGHPAVTVPCGDVHGKPVGVQVVAPRGDDERALQVASVFEASS
ncbi:amidase [Halobaculum limi]|uniref:amidase n=1 Tax=Halobaculum limi TaxID=3031916 RepID=UPI002406FA72|nr:amidase [Halobaculum sp. YSMS11]